MTMDDYERVGQLILEATRSLERSINALEREVRELKNDVRDVERKVK